MPLTKSMKVKIIISGLAVNCTCAQEQYSIHSVVLRDCTSVLFIITIIR